MDRRLNLHHTFEQIYETVMGSSSKGHVYYQPGSDTMLKYPCILYKLSDMPPDFADNSPYRIGHKYEVTVIDRDPLCPIREEIAMLPTCRMSRSPYVSDNLHHYVFTIYD